MNLLWKMVIGPTRLSTMGLVVLEPLVVTHFLFLFLQKTQYQECAGCEDGADVVLAFTGGF